MHFDIAYVDDNNIDQVGNEKNILLQTDASTLFVLANDDADDKIVDRS